MRIITFIVRMRLLPNEYMFPVPYTKKKLSEWSVEKAALYLKDLSQEAKAMASVFSK